jgi:hypothetical protein
MFDGGGRVCPGRHTAVHCGRLLPRGGAPVAPAAGRQVRPAGVRPVSWPCVADPRVGALWCHRSVLGITVPRTERPSPVLIGSPATPAGPRTAKEHHSTTWTGTGSVPPLSTGRRVRMLSSGEASKGRDGAQALAASGITQGITPLSGALAGHAVALTGFSRQCGGSNRPRAPD